MKILDELTTQFRALPGPSWQGQVASALGMTMEVDGLSRCLAVGDPCWVETRSGNRVPCETVGFRGNRAVVMAMTDIQGVREGCKVIYDGSGASVRPNDGWLGRVVNAMGEPIDNAGPLPKGEFVVPLRNTPPNPCLRRPIGKRLETKIRALDIFTPVCQGQRMGVFAGSGVGKSTLMAMLARHATADVNVIGLIGERGREVRSFIEKDLGPEGLERTILIVATSDESPLMRRQAAYLTMAVAEDQRKRGRHVLCMMDSVTRFAMAQREIGLAAGEPPTVRGYTPTVFSELPRLLERAGPGQGRQGDITGIFTVLVDGDDHNEPIADSVRGILDGHLVLSRRIAERGRYPALDIIKSVSRSLPEAHDDWENSVREAARAVISEYEDKEEIIRIGAYRSGADPKIDRAIDIYPKIDAFCRQSKSEITGTHEAFNQLAKILGIPSQHVDEDTADDDTAPPAPYTEILEPEEGEAAGPAPIAQAGR